MKLKNYFIAGISAFGALLMSPARCDVNQKTSNNPDWQAATANETTGWILANQKTLVIGQEIPSSPPLNGTVRCHQSPHEIRCTASAIDNLNETLVSFNLSARARNSLYPEKVVSGGLLFHNTTCSTPLVDWIRAYGRAGRPTHSHPYGHQDPRDTLTITRHGGQGPDSHTAILFESRTVDATQNSCGLTYHLP